MTRRALAFSVVFAACTSSSTSSSAPGAAPIVAHAVAAPVPVPVVAPVAAPSAFAPMSALGPFSGGVATAVVVMLHGYGANGADLASVARALAPQVPGAVFLLPDAFEPMPGSPGAWQWFPLAGSDDALRREGVRRAAARLAPWIDHELHARSIPRSRLALVGFSQGAMLALDLGLHLSPAPAAVVSLSGRLVDDRNPSPAPSPTLVVHGTTDPRIPVAEARLALTRLDQLHARTESLLLPGVGHTITPQGMAAAGDFLRRLLP